MALDYAFLVDKIAQATANTENLGASMLVSASYDGELRVPVLKFYEPLEQRIYHWYDNEGHRPYCYSKWPLEMVRSALAMRHDIVDLRVEEKMDLLTDSKIYVTKIIATDPLAIGGSTRAIRNKIEAWEADIKYYENYLYDRDLVVGTFYRIEGGRIKPVTYEISQRVSSMLEGVMSGADDLLKEYIREWARLLNQPLVQFKRVALDIEVANPTENRLPDPREASQPVLAAALVGTGGYAEVLLLRRGEVPLGEGELQNVQISYFDREVDLLLNVFERILRFPFLITFNGDDFDLAYLYHRAVKLGIPRAAIPIALGREYATIKNGVHLDLYKTFVNRSIQNYAFSSRYIEHTLEGVAEGLLGESKVSFEGSLKDLPLLKLAEYCHTDASLTFRLTSFDDDLLMKLLQVICRVAKMPIDDVARVGVSQWIRNTIYFEHRRRSCLIPRKEELAAKGGASSQAIIKGKKYKGALVVEPKEGVHFNVAVLDFASLYPSIIKVYNLSYETVRCPHEECRQNLVPGTSHWICTKRRGITSLLIGSLRDLRVKYYKNLAKDQTLTKSEKSFYGVTAQGLKVILNASYGVFGFEEFPLYCLPVADATAAAGRYLISRTIEKCRELGIEVIYGDTDSLFLKSPTEEQLAQITKWARDELGIELDLEKRYRFAAFSGRKKNYFGVLPDGSIDIKGLTGKKSHVPQFIKETFYKTLDILRMVNSPEDFEKAREDIRKLVKESYQRLMNRQVPLEQLAFNIMVGKDIDKYTETTPQHIRAAKLLVARGYEIKAGSIISFVKTTSAPGVKPVQLARPEEVDVQKYIEFLKSTFEQILDALGFEFEQILGFSRLEDFFFSP